MAKKKWLLAVTTTILVGLLCATAVYAASAQTETADSKAQAGQRALIGDWPQANDAWDKLTDAQKAELYAAKEAVDAANKALIDKAAEFGLVDADAAAEMKQRTDEATAKMKENGSSPIFGGRFKMDFQTRNSDENFQFKGELTEEDLADMKAKMEEQLQKAVADGKLTQEQADQMLERMNGFGQNAPGPFRFDFKMPFNQLDPTSKGNSADGTSRRLPVNNAAAADPSL